jgi:type 1 glutamine amidotransferase
MSLIKLALLLAFAAGLALPPAGEMAANAPRPEPLPGRAEAYRILIFSKTTGFRHDSIPAAVAAVKNLGAQNNFAADATEDAAAFNDANLQNYGAVVFLLTSGDVLDSGQQAAFERYIRAGGGYVGVHSASDTEHDWAWYGSLVGAYFQSHPAVQPAAVRVEDRQHPSTAGLPDPWVRTDEWYNVRPNPRANVRVLARLDESTYSGGAMGDHPIAWCHAYDGGRAWYTAGGHTSQSYAEPGFLEHLLGGIKYAAERPAAPALTLLAAEGSGVGAAALDSVTFARDPFRVDTAHNFSDDGRTRVALFAANLKLLPGETFSAVDARGEDSQQRTFALPVEFVGAVPNFDWLTQVNVRLPDGLANAGDVWVRVTLRGETSNRVLVRVAQ